VARTWARLTARCSGHGVLDAKRNGRAVPVMLCYIFRPQGQIGSPDLRRISMDSKTIIERFYAEIWNAHDTALAQDICDNDIAFRGSLGAESRGIEPFLAYVDSIHASLSGYRCDIEELVTERNRGFAKMRFSGKHTGDFLGFAPTNRMVSWSGAALFYLADEKIHRVWVLGDLHALHLQLSSDA